MLIAGKVKDAAALLKAGFSQVQCITPTDMILTEAMKLPLQKRIFESYYAAVKLRFPICGVIKQTKVSDISIVVLILFCCHF